MGIERRRGGFGVARDPGDALLRFPQQRERAVQLGTQRTGRVLRMPALLPFDAGPHSGAGTERQADGTRRHPIEQRLPAGDDTHTGHGRPAHGHTAVPGQPAARYAGSSRSRMRRG